MRKPWVLSIERVAVRVRAAQASGVLLHALGAVVAALAQRLPVLGVPEQLTVACMGADVVNDSGGHGTALSAAQRAQGVMRKVARTCFTPVAVVQA